MARGNRYIKCPHCEGRLLVAGDPSTVQLRRYMQHREGKSVRDIAAMENGSHAAVHKSILQMRKRFGTDLVLISNPRCIEEPSMELFANAG